MVTRKTKQSLIATLTFAILPVLVIVKSADTLFGGGPGIAIASHDRLPFIIPDADQKDEVSLSDQQVQALDHIAILKAQQFGSSPLHRVVDNGKVIKKPSTQIVSSKLQVTVQIIMTSTAGNTALIDGKVYKVGQSLAKTSWLISKIDGEARSVTLENTNTGQTLEFVVQSP